MHTYRQKFTCLCPRPANRDSEDIYIDKYVIVCDCDYMYETYVISANVLVKEKTLIDVFVAYCRLVIFGLLHSVSLRCSRLACFGSFSKRSFCSFVVSFVCRLRQVIHHTLCASRSHIPDCSAVWHVLFLSVIISCHLPLQLKKISPASILFVWTRDLLRTQLAAFEFRFSLICLIFFDCLRIAC